MKRIYIAGPMTGRPDFNFPAFFDAQWRLKKEGWETINPALHDIESGYVERDDDGHLVTTDTFDLARVLLWDLVQVAKADAIYLLDGWEASKGAQAEHALAVALGKKLIHEQLELKAERPRIIGIGGRLAAGKDAVADYLVAEHGFVKLGMSDPLLDVTVASNPLIWVTEVEAAALGIASGHWRAADLVVKVGFVDAKTVDDFRAFMMRLGTEGGRNVLGEDIWTDVAFKRITELGQKGQSVVITGIRFPNELAMFNQLTAVGAITTAWVHRPSNMPIRSSHASEQSICAEDFDVIIENDGTLQKLYNSTNTTFNL